MGLTTSGVRGQKPQEALTSAQGEGRGQRAGQGLLINSLLTGKACAETQPQANRNRTFQECHPKASLPLTPGLFPSPDFILLVCVGLPPGSPGSASPARCHLAADICLGCHQRRSQHVGDGPGIRMASSAPSPAPPCSPKLRPAKASVWGAREDPALPPTHNAALVPHSESRGPASWPCDLGQAECDLSVAHHHHF